MRNSIALVSLAMMLAGCAPAPTGPVAAERHHKTSPKAVIERQQKVDKIQGEIEDARHILRSMQRAGPQVPPESGQ